MSIPRIDMPGYKFNGQINVPDKVVEYRRFKIVPKLDFGNSPYLSHGNTTRSGFIILDEQGSHCMPGATWASSYLDARAMIDIWLEAERDATKFWELMEPYRW